MVLLRSVFLSSNVLTKKFFWWKKQPTKDNLINFEITQPTNRTFHQSGYLFPAMVVWSFLRGVFFSNQDTLFNFLFETMSCKVRSGPTRDVNDTVKFWSHLARLLLELLIRNTSPACRIQTTTCILFWTSSGGRGMKPSPSQPCRVDIWTKSRVRTTPTLLCGTSGGGMNI